MGQEYLSDTAGDTEVNLKSIAKIDWCPIDTR